MAPRLEPDVVSADDLIEEMTVENASIALDLLAKDASPLQQYRELTQNAIQAIQATPEKTGLVLWDVDWRMVEEKGVYKLACIDTGEGMTEEEQIKYINRLFVSGRTQGATANFGIGAKVTAGAKNPYGLYYCSWKNGKSSMIHFRRHGPPGSPYGLERFDIDGQLLTAIPIKSEHKPPEIRDHGTMVVLLGSSPDDHTILPPDGSPFPGMKWLSKYLNMRYFEFPEGIQVRVREFPANQEDWPKSRPLDEEKSGTRRRRIQGAREHLMKMSDELGELDLSDGAKVRWFIIREDHNSQDIYFNSGHSGAIFQSEIYDLLDGNPHRIRLQSFGILYSAKRLALFIEPSGDVTATVSRTALTIGGEPLPWEAWGREFREKIPLPIAALERSVRDAAGEQDPTKSIRERLQPYRQLFKVTSWREHEQGRERASGKAPSGGGPSGRESVGDGPWGTGDYEGGRGTARRDYLSLLDPEGVPADRMHFDRDIPEIRWVKFSQTGHPEDRAAVYVREKNIIFANSEFRVFGDMINRVVDQHGIASSDEEVKIVREVVHEWYGQVLVESVIRSWNFEHEVKWQDKDYDQLISPESLTMAVLPFTFIDSRIRQVVGTKLKPKSPR